MIYEWYTGSDRTKGIAREFEKVFFRLRNKLPVEEIIRRIKELAQREQDANMRAKFLTAAARLHLQHPEKVEQGLSMGEVVKLYDPLAANFPWVVTDYLEACLWASMEAGQTGDEQARLAATPYVLALALWQQGRLDQTTAIWAIRMVAESLLELGRKFGSRTLLEMAVVAAVRAHHWDPDEPATLEVLAEAHGLLGDIGAERRVFDELCELDPRKKSQAKGLLRESLENMLTLFGLRKKGRS